MCEFKKFVSIPLGEVAVERGLRTAAPRHGRLLRSWLRHLLLLEAAALGAPAAEYTADGAANDGGDDEYLRGESE